MGTVLVAWWLFVGSRDLVPETGIDLVERRDFETDGEISTEKVSVVFTESVCEMLIDSE